MVNTEFVHNKVLNIQISLMGSVICNQCHVSALRCYLDREQEVAWHGNHVSASNRSRCGDHQIW